MKLLDFFIKIKKKIYDVIFPRKCIGCGYEGTWLCRKCYEKIITIKTPFCPQCQTITPNGHYCARHRSKYSLTGIIIAAHYKEGPIRAVIAEFKYNKIRELGDILANIIIERLRLGFPIGDLILLPVPLHRSRLAERGFNQAEILAKKIAAAYEIDMYSGILKKIKKTKLQMKLSGEDRKKNLNESFKFIGKRGLVKNKTILLVDDVTTTGTTLNECAKILRKEGARQVWGVVLAKG